MDRELIKEKLLFSVIDKLLIGLVVTVVATLVSDIVQTRQQQADLVNQERVAVARVVTDVLADQRSRLMKSVSEFVGLCNHLIATGSARNNDAARLQKLEQEIRGAIAMLETIHSARKNPTCKPANDAVLDKFAILISSELTLPLTSSKMTPENIQTKLDALRVAYTKVLEFTRCLAVDTIRDEVGGVLETS